MGDISSFDLTHVGVSGGGAVAIARTSPRSLKLTPPAKKSKTNHPADDDVNVTLLDAAVVIVGATVQIPVRALPLHWKQTPWMESLTLRPKASAAAPQKPAPIHTAFVVGDDDDAAAAVLHVPRFWGLRHVAGADFRDTRTSGSSFATTDLRFGATLNPVQAEATASALRQLRALGGAMLVLPCGFGKTVCALWLSAQLRRRTLVVVHSDALADQWLQRIGTFLPGAVIGRIQQDVVLVDGCDVVVGMIQSLVKRSYDAATLDSFGLVVVDEAHHVAAPMFSQALRKLPARFVLGLSATPDRGDGLGHALEWFLGPIAFRAERERTDRVDVSILTYTRGLQREITNRRGDVMCSTMVSNLALDVVRTRYVRDLVLEQARQNRNVMVLSDRLDQLVALEDMLVRDAPTLVVARVVGGTKAAARDDGFQNATVILSTYHYASEGLDIPRLDTLVMATPRSSIEQSVGRILRPFANKPRPRVIDVKDPFSLFEAMSWKRHRYYKSQNYAIRFAADQDPDGGDGDVVVGSK
jgi:superfamily II DNA or RNA helicase